MTDNFYEKLSEKRKLLQEQGLVPEWYSTGALQIFEAKYQYETDRSVRGQFERIAKTAAKHVQSVYPEAEQKFFELLWKGWLSPSTPVLANMGTNRGMPVSCSGTFVEDSIDGFYNNLHEVACLTKEGFGTASDFSHIRPRGSPISVGGKANGVVPVIKEHVQAMRNVAQGTARRGAWAVYLDIEHGDFDELWNYLMEDQDDLNIGWTIKQSFIDALNDGNPEAIRRYQRALKAKMVYGKGYFFFIDKANNKRPAMYVDKGLMINNSQLCLTGDTVIDIRTADGTESQVPLEQFVMLFSLGYYGDKVLVKSYSRENQEVSWEEITAAAKTGETDELYQIETEEGYVIRCTSDHLIYTKNRGYVKASELRETDELMTL